jgi:hypothetical protein
MTALVPRTPALFHSNCDVDRGITCSCLFCILYFHSICRTLLNSIFVLCYVCFQIHDTYVRLSHCPVVSFRSVFVEQFRPQSVQQVLTEQFCVHSTNVNTVHLNKSSGPGCALHLHVHLQINDTYCAYWWAAISVRSLISGFKSIFCKMIRV